MNDLSAFLNALPDGVVAVSEQHIVLFANAAVYDTLGVLPNSMVGLPLSDCLKDQNLLMQLDKTGHESFLTLETDINYPRKLRLRIRIVPLQERSGEPDPPVAIIIFTDVSRELSTAEDRERNSKLETMRLLTAGVAHELGNPLNSIIMKADLTERLVAKLPDSETKEKIAKDLDVIIGESERLKRIVEDFLKAARPLSFRPVETDLKKLCERCLAVMEPELHARDIAIQQYLSPVPPALLDEDLLSGAVINVIRNAAEAMPEGGLMIVRLETEGDFFKLSVRDNGTGMSEETAEKMFDPFYTTKQTGTGLGMLQIKRAMEAHSGTIEIKTRLGKGTTVTLKAPLRQSETHVLDSPEAK